MIRVEFIGGAKKSFKTSSINIDVHEITISDLFEMLQHMRIANSPELDRQNMLVAINGADTSVTGGMHSSVARDGDTVSIIPVIHGGAPGTKRVTFVIRGRRIDVARVRPGGPVGAAFLDKLRGRHPKLRIQAVSARFVLGESHARKILALSIESDRRHVLLANRIETDILMRFALATQISAAIEDAGIRPRSRSAFVLVSMGPAKALDSLHGDLDSSYLADPFAPKGSASFLRRRFRITKKMIDATASDAPLEDILVERAAILGAV